MIFTALAGIAMLPHQAAGHADAIQGYRVCGGIVVGILFGIFTALLAGYQLNKRTTIEMADALAERRKKFAAENPATV